MGISSFSSSTCRWNFVCLCLEHELFTPSFYFSFMWSEVDILAPALAAFSFFYQAIRALLFISSSSSTHTATRHEGKIGFLPHSDNLRRNPWRTGTGFNEERTNLIKKKKKRKWGDWWKRQQTEIEINACCWQVLHVKTGSPSTPASSALEVCLQVSLCCSCLFLMLSAWTLALTPSQKVLLRIVTF